MMTESSGRPSYIVISRKFREANDFVKHMALEYLGRPIIIVQPEDLSKLINTEGLNAYLVGAYYENPVIDEILAGLNLRRHRQIRVRDWR